MSTTVSYNGNTIATVDNETVTLKTAETWMGDDLTLTDSSLKVATTDYQSANDYDYKTITFSVLGEPEQMFIYLESDSGVLWNDEFNVRRIVSAKYDGTNCICSGIFVRDGDDGTIGITSATFSYANGVVTITLPWGDNYYYFWAGNIKYYATYTYRG